MDPGKQGEPEYVTYSENNTKLNKMILQKVNGRYVELS